ncbi:MAG: hypothetical protein H0V82_10555 [Candidatus Protochlamydia sp.]|nr:hypothetical protein [Candidatus Protochlamydia sp.]
MKLIRHTLLLLTLGSYSFAAIEDKPSDRSVNETYSLPFTLDRLAQKIALEPYPAIALFHLWKNAIAVSNTDQMSVCTPLELLNSKGSCSKKEFNSKFLQLCRQLGIQTRCVTPQDEGMYDFGHDEEWTYLDLETNQYYLGWDNETIISSEDIKDDPLLILRSKHDRATAEVKFDKAWEKFARFKVASPFLGKVNIEIESSKEKENALNFNDLREEVKGPVRLKIINEKNLFDFCSPSFKLQSVDNQNIDLIHWQISFDPAFALVHSDLDQVAPFTSQLSFQPITETFFNPATIYYLRVKGCNEGKWGAWSENFQFVIQKPEKVALIEFNKIIESHYELNWERETEEDASIDYLVFASNSLDFIPCIYCTTQINGIDGEVIESEENDNLVAVTKDAKLIVDGSLAYYRIITRQNGQFSVPSPIIRVYDEDLVQPRNVLQLVEEEGRHVAKRVLFPATYPWTQLSLPEINQPVNFFENSLLKLHAHYTRNAVLPLVEARAYQQSPYVTPEIWEKVRPYFLPENHPAKPKLDRMFSAKRVILTPETFREAGFKRHRQGRFSRIMASPHPDMPEYFFKGFPDSELNIKADWYKLATRIEGAKAVKKWIVENKMQSIFTVPNKWLYPLPEHPSPPKSSRYLRKNFILVAENMRILEHDKNEKAYKNKVTKKFLDRLYRMLDDVGLYDSVYAFNVPFCKNGKIAVIDTEYFYRWPVPFQKFTKYFSKEMRQYWEYLIDHKGPKGHVEKHHPK